MNLDNIRKQDNVARVLRERGLAPDIDTATKMSQDLVHNAVVDSVKVQLGETPQEVDLPTQEAPFQAVSSPDQAPQMQPSQAMPEIDLSSYIKKEVFSSVLQQLSDEFSKEIDQLKAQVSNLKSELVAVKNNPVAPSTSQSEPTQTVFKQPEPQQPQQSSQPQNSGGHARSGNYDSGDVSIEKMFYAGTR